MLKPIETSGPDSGTIPIPPLLTKDTGVVPAEDQFWVAGSNSSELVPFWLSMVNTIPFGSNEKFSSLLGSALPVLRRVQVITVAGNAAIVAKADSLFCGAPGSGLLL